MMENYIVRQYKVWSVDIYDYTWTWLINTDTVLCCVGE